MNDRLNDIVRVEKWIIQHGLQYEDAFDMAVECAVDLDLCEMCEVNGDRTLIPPWIQRLTQQYFDGELV